MGKKVHWHRHRHRHLSLGDSGIVCRHFILFLYLLLNGFGSLCFFFTAIAGNQRGTFAIFVHGVKGKALEQRSEHLTMRYDELRYLLDMEIRVKGKK